MATTNAPINPSPTAPTAHHTPCRQAEACGQPNANDDRNCRGSKWSTNEETPTNSLRLVAPQHHLSTQMKWTEPLLYYLSGIGLALKCLHLLADIYLVHVHETTAPITITPRNEPVCDSSSTQTKIHRRTNTTDINMESDNEPPLIDESNEDYGINKRSRCNLSPPTLPPNNNCHNQTAINSKGTAPPSPSTEQSDGAHLTSHRENQQQRTLYPTATRLTRHGMEIVMLEEMILGRKSLPWRVRYRNQDGLIISFLFWLWYRSWTTTYAIYIGTHVASELVLWFNIGKRYAHTMGSDHIHPNIQLPTTSCYTNKVRETHHTQLNTNQTSPQHKLYMASNAMQYKTHSTEFAVAISNASKSNEGTVPTTAQPDQYRIKASMILSAAKGKRKTIDRPQRYKRWKLVNNQSHPKNNIMTIPSPEANEDKLYTVPICRHNPTKVRHSLPPLGLNGWLRLHITIKRKPHNHKHCQGATKMKHNNITTPHPTVSLKKFGGHGKVVMSFVITIHQTLIEGSGWVRPKRDVIKWYPL